MLTMLCIISNSGLAGTTCQTTSSGTAYCLFNGTIKELYINSSNTILVYFDTPVSVSVPQSVGLNVTQTTATALTMTESNSDFAKLFYSTALAAHMAGRNVKIQMRDVEGGYLKFDRIWIE